MDKDVFGLIQRATEQFNSGFSDDRFLRVVAFITLVATCIWVVLYTLKQVVELLAGTIQGLKGIGFEFSSHKASRLELRRRQQFCAVLRADLDAMAKAENWNDQWFTDLEAEVEADGAYFPSALAKLLGRRSVGLRRIPSLVQAISSSNERCMLLVGEPGSGKSIALRHLARRMADSGTGKFRGYMKIPLYVNLKEVAATNKEIDANFIQEFVLENVRRGDADTAAYVKEHWDAYKEQGVWCFLFDSFDEIPAVLHSPNGSEPVALYTEAVRKFMDGMGSCRGVLASREYKGPGALPWSKLRILPLDTVRQDELIENTFLPEPDKILVRRHLARKRGEMFGNPLFLSLLCRYVRATQALPAHDYDLLAKHIEGLASRDPSYLGKKYQLNAQQLLHGARLIAVLFALRPELSLAPKFSDLEQHFNTVEGADAFELENLLTALIDVKVGRSDVKEAKPGDRRFTFAHRRYQETLFVQHLATDDEFLDKEEFFTNSRWREFAVTLLQSQPKNVVEHYASVATALLDSFSLEPQRIDGQAHFPWLGTELLHVLQIVNEGFENRLSDATQSLRSAISRHLEVRWEKGDLYDKVMVVRYGCLLPEERYSQILLYAVKSRVEPLMQAAFLNARFLIALPETLADWVQLRFANEVVLAESKIDLQRLDALSAHLPRELGAKVIFNRCRSLRSFVFESRLLTGFFAQLFRLADGLIGQSTRLGNAKEGRITFVEVFCIEIAVALCTISFEVAKNFQISRPLAFLVGFAISLAPIALALRLMLRGHSDPLTIRTTVQAISQKFVRVPRGSLWALLAALATVMLVLGAVVFFAIHTAPEIIVISTVVLTSAIVLWKVFYIQRKDARIAKRISDAPWQDGALGALKVLDLSGISPSDIARWLEANAKLALTSYDSTRAVLKFSQEKFPTSSFESPEESAIARPSRLWNVLLMQIDSFSPDVDKMKAA